MIVLHLIGELLRWFLNLPQAALTLCMFVMVVFAVGGAWHSVSREEE